MKPVTNASSLNTGGGGSNEATKTINLSHNKIGFQTNSSITD